MDNGDLRHMHANKYEVHINIDGCAAHSGFVSKFDFFAYARQGWIYSVYRQWKLKTHQGIIGSGTRQIMFVIVHNTLEGLWRSTKCS